VDSVQTSGQQKTADGCRRCLLLRLYFSLLKGVKS